MKYSKNSSLEVSVEVKEEYDEEELQSVLKAELDDAKDFIDQVGDERAESTEYYLGNSPEGGSDIQSEYVSTDVRDAVLHIMPSLMRTFFGTKKIVEFIPKNAEDIPAASQQTDYINYIFSQKNPGFSILYSTFKDALIRKTGFVKAYYDQSIDSTTHEYKNLSYEQYVSMMMDEDIEVIEDSPTYVENTIINELGEEEKNQVVESYDLKVRKIKSYDKVCIESVPPEEILISRNARSLKDSSYVAHRRIVSVSDLVAMGYEKEEIEMYGNYGNDVSNEDERRARNPLHELNDVDRSDTGGKEILYIEHYIRYDKDQDGINELIKVCTVGDGLEIINCEAWDDLPIVMFCPDPEPHTAIGSCPADYLKPIQDVKSQIVRDSLDSLGHSIFPRMGVVEGQVNIDDVLNNDIGQPIRMRQPGAVQPFTVPFAGKEAFPFLQYLDEQKENRTGVSKASMGLNADALQSSTKAAVSSTMSAAQGRIELICRHFAESMKDLFSLINNLTIKNQDKAEIIRLNNEFVEIDPRYWDTDKDLLCNVGISKSSDDEKMEILTQLSAKQEQILQTLGPQNPLVSFQQYANTMIKMIELAGFKDSSQFINSEVPPMPPPDPSQEKPSAEEQLAMAETMKAQAQARKIEVDAETDRMKVIMNDDFNRDKFEVETRLQMAELYAKHGATFDIGEVEKIMERDANELRTLQKAQAQGLFNNGNSEEGNA